MHYSGQLAIKTRPRTEIRRSSGLLAASRPAPTPAISTLPPPNDLTLAIWHANC